MSNQGYELVRSLTTEVGPRLAGTESEARAREWAVEKLRGLGLQNVHVEPFQVPVWLRGVELGEIVSPFPQALTITALGGSSSTGEQGLEAEVVAFNSLSALRQASRRQVEGKIVFIDEVMVRSRDGSGYGAAVQKRRATAYVSQQMGAVAALIRSVGTSSHRFAHAGQMRQADADGDSGVPMAALAAPDADQLYASAGIWQARDGEASHYATTASARDLRQCDWRNYWSRGATGNCAGRCAPGLMGPRDGSRR